MCRGGLYTQNRKGALKQAIAVLTKIHLHLLAFNTKSFQHKIEGTQCCQK